MNNAKIVWPSSGVATKLEDLGLTRDIDSTLHKSRINDKPEHERCMSPEDMDDLTVVRSRNW